MTKKLAIFCDGTWNNLALDTPTNVVRLAKCVAPLARDGRTQIVYYDEGVGVGGGVSRAVDAVTKIIGGAFGAGLNRKIEAAYRFLVLNYEPGDDIYIFGFSRGAYTARSLTGMIRKCGILRRSCFNKVPEALQRYRDGSHPASPEMVQFRDGYAHPVAAGREDAAHVDLAPRTEAAPATREQLYQYRPEPTYRIMFLGVWDTVGEMGVPSRIDFLRFNRRYQFHDLGASSLIASLRHGIAANEKRGLFDVTPVENIDALNREWAAATGWDVEQAGTSRHVPYAFRPFQQRWFPGDHCSVGGGYGQTSLSSAALLWMAEGADWAGLAFIDAPGNELAEAQRHVDPCASLGRNGTGGIPAGALRQVGPPNLDAIAEPTARRWHARADYRPPNLTILMNAPGEPPTERPPSDFPAA